MAKRKTKVIISSTLSKKEINQIFDASFTRFTSLLDLLDKLQVTKGDSYKMDWPACKRLNKL